VWLKLLEYLKMKIITYTKMNNNQLCALCSAMTDRTQSLNSEFEVQEIPTPQLRRQPMSYKVKLNKWWCDCRQFQALKLHCPHVITVYSFSHLQLAIFVSPLYNNILKAYEIQFHIIQNQDYWSPYTGLIYDIWLTHEKKQSWKTNYMIPDSTLHHLCTPITNILRNYKYTEIMLKWHDLRNLVELKSCWCGMISVYFFWTEIVPPQHHFSSEKIH